LGENQPSPRAGARGTPATSKPGPQVPGPTNPISLCGGKNVNRRSPAECRSTRPCPRRDEGRQAVPRYLEIRREADRQPQSSPSAAKAVLCRSGESEWADGSPITRQPWYRAVGDQPSGAHPEPPALGQRLIRQLAEKVEENARCRPSTPLRRRASRCRRRRHMPPPGSLRRDARWASG